jgi:hypothetical protein
MMYLVKFCIGQISNLYFKYKILLLVFNQPTVFIVLERSWPEYVSILDCILIDIVGFNNIYYKNLQYGKYSVY